MEINIRQMKIINCPAYFFNDNMIVNTKDFDSSLLEIHKLSHQGVFSLNIYYIKYIPTKNLNHMGVNHDKDFLYLFLDDADGYIEENNGTKCLVFTPTAKNKKPLKNYIKLWEETEGEIEAINDDEPIEYRKNLPLGKTCNILHMIIVPASPLEKNGKYYPQIF